MTIDLVIPTYKPGEKLFVTQAPVRTDSSIGYDFSDEFGGILSDHVSEQYPNVVVKHIKKEEFDHGATRDYGTCCRDAEIIAFMTDDAVPGDKYMVENLLKAFETRVWEPL